MGGGGWGGGSGGGVLGRGMGERQEGEMVGRRGDGKEKDIDWGEGQEVNRKSLR